MHWYAGTSGYSYKEWSGTFYPQDLRPDDWLTYYASRLPAVEINNTFYRMPRRHVVAAWHSAVPAQFRFVIKGSRRITHQAKLEDTEESVTYLANRVAVLEDKLACVLLQLPPFLRKGHERLKSFLQHWPKEIPLAIEFRHDSWFDEEIQSLLQVHKVAIAVSDDEKMAPPEFLNTTDWVYLRLRRANYRQTDLTSWRRRIERLPVKTGYAFFKHEDGAGGPLMAERFLALGTRQARRGPRTAASASAVKKAGQRQAS